MGTFVSPISEAKNIVSKYKINEIPVDVEAICRKEGISVYYVDMSEIEAQTKKQISGIIQKQPGKCVIFVNENDIRSRQRFTIAHELGHFFLHMEDEENKVITSFRMDRSSKETQANLFAAELLMPEELVQKEYKKMVIPVSDSLAEKFHVSKQAMRIRLDNLELVYV